jgi:hypothetical protein
VPGLDKAAYRSTAFESGGGSGQIKVLVGDVVTTISATSPDGEWLGRLERGVRTVLNQLFR